MTKAIKLKPDVIITIGMDEVPLPSDYGAAEMKFFIRRNTYKGAFITMTLLLLILMMNCVMQSVERAAADIKVAPITRTSLEDLPPPDMDASDIAPPPEVIINTGPAARAGNPVPVPDAMIAPDLQDFATIDVIDRAAAAGGTGEDLGGFAGNIDWDRKEVEVTTLADKMPDPDDFVAVEKEPNFDLRKLQGLVEF